MPATSKKTKPQSPRKKSTEALQKDHCDVRVISLALQGGGAHGAFTWGVLDQLLMDERLRIEAVTATSAGAMNAAMMAYGLATGGRDEARKLLRIFWRRVSQASSMSMLQATPFEKMMGARSLDYSPSFMAMDMMTRFFSPYQLNWFDVNPLRNIVAEMVDFDYLAKHNPIKLFVNATQVKTGKVKVFGPEALTLDMVMASACLPFLFKAVEVDGEPYWDGGYSGNPAIFPLFYHCQSSDVVLVQINPMVREMVPTKAPEIIDRINEISFNSNLMSEMRAIDFVSRLIHSGHLDAKSYKPMLVHMIEAPAVLGEYDYSTKLNADWDFLVHLHDAGVQAATEWVDANFDKLGVESSAPIRETFLL